MVRASERGAIIGPGVWSGCRSWASTLGCRQETKRRARAPGPADEFRGIGRSVHLIPIVAGDARIRFVRDQRPQLLAGLEHRHRPRRDLHRLAGARVARHPGLAPADLEGAEASHLDVVLLLQGVLARIKKGIDEARAVFLGDERPLSAGHRGGYLLYEVDLGHASPNRLTRLA